MEDFNVAEDHDQRLKLNREFKQAIKEMAIALGCAFALIIGGILHEQFNVPPSEFQTRKGNPSARSLQYWSKIEGGYVCVRTADSGKTWYKENGWFLSSRRLSLVDFPERLQEIEETLRSFESHR